MERILNTEKWVFGMSLEFLFWIYFEIKFEIFFKIGFFGIVCAVFFSLFMFFISRPAVPSQSSATAAPPLVSDINGTKKVERPNVAPPPPPLPPRDRSKPSLPQSKPRERKYPLLISGLTDNGQTHNATQHGAEIYQNPDADGLVVEKSTAAFRKLSTGSIPPSSPSAINGDSQRTQQAIVINQSGREVSFWPRFIGSLYFFCSFFLLFFCFFFIIPLVFFSTKGPMFPSSVDHDSLQWFFLLHSLHT